MKERVHAEYRHLTSGDWAAWSCRFDTGKRCENGERVHAECRHSTLGNWAAWSYTIQTGRRCGNGERKHAEFRHLSPWGWAAQSCTIPDGLVTSLSGGHICIHAPHYSQPAKVPQASFGAFRTLILNTEAELTHALKAGVLRRMMRKVARGKLEGDAAVEVSAGGLHCACRSAGGNTDAVHR